MGQVATVSRLSMYIGVLSLGIALGSSVGLAAIQPVCQSGGFTSGVVSLGGQPTGVCWQNAQMLQTVGNVTGYASAALLLGGGLLDRYDGRVQEALAEVAS